jgi:hypothetical protein
MDDQKVFDWTNEKDQEEYKKQVEQDNLNTEIYPPRDRRSVAVREFLKQKEESK